MRLAILILFLLTAPLAAQTKTVKFFDGKQIRDVPLDTYVDLMSGKVPVAAVVGLTTEQVDPIADLQSQINDIRNMVANINAKLANVPGPAPLPPAQPTAGGCGQAVQVGACGQAAAVGACGAAGADASSGGLFQRKPLRTLLKRLFGGGAAGAGGC